MGDYYCEVAAAGSTTDNTEGGVRIRLLNGDAFASARWFSAPPECKREMLATALAAMAGGFTVLVNLADPPTEYGWINYMYMLKKE